MYGRTFNTWKDYSNNPVDWDLIDNYSRMSKELNSRWDNIFKIAYPSIAKLVEERNEQQRTQFEEHHLIRQYNIGDRVMYLSPQYADGNVNDKWAPVYLGPATIISRTRDRYQCQEDIDEVTSGGGSMTRALPPSHIKIFTKPERIVSQKRGRFNELIYLIQHSNDDELWTPAEYASNNLINQWNEQQMLAEAESNISKKKIDRIQKEMNKTEIDLRNAQERLARQQLILERNNMTRNNHFDEDIQINLSEGEN